MEKEQLVESGGGWNPGKLEYKPLFVWPPRPFALLKWLFHFPNGHIFPWAAIHIIITLISYVYFLPAFERFANFQWDWVGIIFLRNFIILFVYTGLWHLHLHTFRSQEDKFKYNLKPLGKGKKWLFGTQTRENMFWSLCSALPIWTAYECIMLWCYSNDYMLFPIHNWLDHPIYFCILLFVLIPVIHHIHFYFIHRLIHWPPLYKYVHSLHHKNVQVGPWSGLSMHPVEHLLYISTIFVHFVIPSHPFHFIYMGIHTQLGATKGHSGYERLIVSKNGSSIPSAGYFHYLHHKYFECNYGEITSPLDKWFGSFHDGTQKTHDKLFGQKN